MGESVAREVLLLVRGEHSDPHHILGVHDTLEGVVLRVYRPDARKVVAVLAGGASVLLDRIHEGGVFAGLIAEPGCDAPPYKLSVVYPGDKVFEIEDPYRHLPTFGELDMHLVREGRHEDLYEKLGAHVRVHEGVRGTSFAVWAPSARSVRVVGEFNGWDGRLHPMRGLGDTGVWELFIPGVDEGVRYKFELLTEQGWVIVKADPYAQRSEMPPATGGVVTVSHHEWGDGAWMKARAEGEVYDRPLSIYEMHLGSWRRGAEGEEPSYREVADELAAYCVEMGFTHVEFLPLAEYPYGPSWGYQVSYYFAPTARYGEPDDLRYLIDRLHESGVGVIVDWVPAHFPRDDWALARYDGTALYEHADPRQGEHPDWGTLVFNFGRNEVRNFLVANALYWLQEFHIDGLRVDAVASMLYLDYSREEGQWVPNEHGGRENLEAIAFLRELNAVVHRRHPGVLMIAEESTSWSGVSRPTWTGGLGFGLKWNMGWMHDTLSYFAKEPVHRRWHHHQLTFALIYAWHENFVLALSHDEVVHGKGSLARKMPGDRWQQLANLRSLYSYMWAHPGKKMLFMGGEFAQSSEWNHAQSLDWHLLAHEEHRGVQRLVRDLNARYREEPALWERDFEASGFQWIDANDADDNVFSFLRYDADKGRCLACVANLAPVVREKFRLGLPRGGRWFESLNSDSELYGGSNIGNYGAVRATEHGTHGLAFSAELTLPPLAVLWLVPEEQVGSASASDELTPD